MIKSIRHADINGIPILEEVTWLIPGTEEGGYIVDPKDPRIVDLEGTRLFPLMIINKLYEGEDPHPYKNPIREGVKLISEFEYNNLIAQHTAKSENLVKSLQEESDNREKLKKDALVKAFKNGLYGGDLETFKLIHGFNPLEYK